MIPLTADEYGRLAHLAEQDGDEALAAKLRAGQTRESNREAMSKAAPIRRDAIARGLGS